MSTIVSDALPLPPRNVFASAQRRVLDLEEQHGRNVRDEVEHHAIAKRATAKRESSERALAEAFDVERKAYTAWRADEDAARVAEEKRRAALLPAPAPAAPDEPSMAPRGP